MPAKQENFTATELKAGALVLASLVVLLGFLIALRGCGPGGDEPRTYNAAFSDISGLDRGADVRFGGVKVGRVIELDTDPEDRSLIRVTAEVLGRIPVNHASIASIQQITLTSSKHLEISTGSSEAPLHDDGDELQTTVGAGAFGLPDLQGVVVRLERLLDGLNILTGSDPGAAGEAVDLGQVFASLKTSLDEAARTLTGLNSVIEENRPAMREIVQRMGELEQAAGELLQSLDALVGENREPLRASAVNLEQLTTEARRLVGDLRTSLQQLAGSLESFGANADGMLEDQRPALEEVLANLRQTTRNLSEFSRVLAEQPEALVRGKSPRGRSE